MSKRREISFDRKRNRCPLCRQHFYSKDCPHSYGDAIDALELKRILGELGQRE